MTVRPSVGLVLTVLVFSAWVSGCVPQEEPLAWERLSDGWGAPVASRYQEGAPDLAVVTDQGTVGSLKDRIRPSYSESISGVDFSAYLVAVVWQGQQGSTGYSVEVTNVQRKDRTITIQAQFHEPGPRDLTSPLVTSPNYVLKIKKTPSVKDEFTFVLTANGLEVARQTQRIP